MSSRFTRQGVPGITSRQPSQRIATLSWTIVRIVTPMISIDPENSRGDRPVSGPRLPPGQGPCRGQPAAHRDRDRGRVPGPEPGRLAVRRLVVHGEPRVPGFARPARPRCQEVRGHPVAPELGPGERSGDARGAGVAHDRGHVGCRGADPQEGDAVAVALGDEGGDGSVLQRAGVGPRSAICGAIRRKTGDATRWRRSRARDPPARRRRPGRRGGRRRPSGSGPVVDRAQVAHEVDDVVAEARRASVGEGHVVVGEHRDDVLGAGGADPACGERRVQPLPEGAARVRRRSRARRPACRTSARRGRRSGWPPGRRPAPRRRRAASPVPRSASAVEDAGPRGRDPPTPPAGPARVPEGAGRRRRRGAARAGRARRRTASTRHAAQGCPTGLRRRGRQRRRGGDRVVVPPTGFEPVISTLKGWRPRPLDDGGSSAGRPAECTSQVPRVPAPDQAHDHGGRERHERRHRDQAAEQRRQHGGAVAARHGRSGSPRAGARTAIAANTSPMTANPDAISGTWSASRTNTAVAEERRGRRRAR